MYIDIIHIYYIYKYIYIYIYIYILAKIKNGIKNNLYIYKKLKLKALQLARAIKQIVF